MASHERFIGRVREGRGPWRRPPLTGLLDDLDLPLRTVAQALAIPERTMHRLKTSAVVPSTIADKVARVHDVLTVAVEILGSKPAAQSWLMRANPSLGGATPLSRLDTSHGWQQVKEVLGRMEHGIPS